MFRSRRPGKPGETTQIPRIPAAGGPGHEGLGRPTIYARRTMIGPGWFDRRDALRRLAEDPFDVLVVGGGITGAGVRPRRRLPGPAHRRWSSGTTSPRARPRSPRSWSTAGCATSSRARSGSSTRPCTSASGSRRNAPHLVKVLPFLIPMFTGKDGVLNPQAGPGARLGHVDVRPHRRRPHRQAPQAHLGRRGAGPHADAPPRPPGRVVPLLRRPGRRRPPHAHPRPHRGHRPRRGRRQRRPAGRGPQGPPPARSRAPPSRPTASGSTSRCSSSSTPAASGPTTCAPSTRARTPTRSARPRASTSRCRGSSCATTSPSSCRCPRTSARSSWCRGATSPTSAPPTPTTTGPLDDPQCTAEDIEYLLRAINFSTAGTITRATSSARGPASARS